jgi:hypothetical protein
MDTVPMHLLQTPASSKCANTYDYCRLTRLNCGHKGAFLYGDLKDGKVIYMKVPCGFKKFYPGNVVHKLKKLCIYGLEQPVMAFWCQLLLCM